MVFSFNLKQLPKVYIYAHLYSFTYSSALYVYIHPHHVFCMFLIFHFSSTTVLWYFFFWLLLSFCGFVFDFKMCNFIDLFLESNLLTLLRDILYTLRLYRFITILMIFKRDCKLFLIMTFDLGNKIVQTVSTITCQNVPSVSLTAWTQDSFLVFYVCL